MSINASIIVTSSKMEELRNRLKTLAQMKVQSGHFKESGNHPDAEIPYPDLAQLLVNAFPSRDLRIGVTQHFLDKPFKNVVHISTKDYIYHKKPVVKTLEIVGDYVSNYAKGLFGVPSSFNPSNSYAWAELKGGDTPLYFEGHLKNSWASKVTPSGRIKY